MVAVSALAVARHLTVRARVHRPPAFASHRLQVLFAVQEGQPAQAFVPLIVYLLEHEAERRPAWQRAVVRAVRRWLDFEAAAMASVADGPHGNDLLRSFAAALVQGTVRRGGRDPLGLGWKPTSRLAAQRCLEHLNRFSDWLSNRTGVRALNPWREATAGERLVLLRCQEKRSAHALLAHLRRCGPFVPRTRSVRIGRGALAHGHGHGSVCAFDTEKFAQLLAEGFGLRPGQPLNRVPAGVLRDAMIAILLHAGGLRISEVFHLWTIDAGVNPDDPESARVRLYHPEEGEAPLIDGRPRWRDRADYLLREWGLLPRHVRLDRRFHAGWKNLALPDQQRGFAPVHFFPLVWGQVFLRLHQVYRTKRPLGCRHPYLFVSHRGVQRGQPYTIKAFEGAHARAVRRIGLQPAKHLGTTVHGHRHAYARALTSARCSPQALQACLHHRSIESQAVYTTAAAEHVDDVLRHASARLGSTVPSTP